MGYSKIVLGDRTLIDLTQDTVSEENLLVGYKAHGADGEEVNGKCDFDVNSRIADTTLVPHITTDGSAYYSNELLAGKQAFVNGMRFQGTMVNYGGKNGEISTKDGEFSIPAGYHDGSGKVRIAESAKTNLISENIKQGVEILGVIGSLTGQEGVVAENAVVENSLDGVKVTPTTSAGYNYLASVTVKPITVTETPAPRGGGLVVTIG